jgi:hypothetical protein
MLNNVMILQSIGKDVIGLQLLFLSETKTKIDSKIIFHILKNYELENY